MSSENQKFTDIVVKIIDSANVHDAKIFANTYAAIPEGIMDELLRKFESYRSVAQVPVKQWVKSELDNRPRNLLRQDDKLQRWRLLRFTPLKFTKGYDLFESYTTCPSEMANNMRRKLWSKDIRGITIPPGTHQDNHLTPSEGMDDEWSRCNHFFYTFIEPSFVLDTNLGKCGPIPRACYKVLYLSTCCLILREGYYTGQSRESERISLLDVQNNVW